MIAGIGGYVMLRSSSAASVCKSKTYALNSKSECVRYAQYMLGVSHDAKFGPNTQKALIKKTGQSKLNSTAWSNLCNRNYSVAVNKQRDAACKGGSYVKKLGNPTIGYKVRTSIHYKSPSAVYYEPVKPTCSKKTVYKGVGSKAKAQKKQEAVSKVKKQYKTDVSEYKAYVKKSKEYTAAQIMTKCNKADKSVSSLLNSDAFKLVTVKS